jgi:hypothetical protein
MDSMLVTWSVVADFASRSHAAVSALEVSSNSKRRISSIIEEICSKYGFSHQLDGKERWRLYLPTKRLWLSGSKLVEDYAFEIDVRIWP